jgi:hypothetical protein
MAIMLDPVAKMAIYQLLIKNINESAEESFVLVHTIRRQ